MATKDDYVVGDELDTLEDINPDDPSDLPTDKELRVLEELRVLTEDVYGDIFGEDKNPVNIGLPDYLGV